MPVDSRVERLIREILLEVIFVGLVIGALFGFVVGYGIHALFGNPASARTQTLATFLGALPYWTIRTKLRWRSWVGARRGRLAGQVVRDQSQGANIHGWFNRTTIRVESAPGARRQQPKRPDE